MAGLGIVISPQTPYPLLGKLAREAEDAGFSGALVPEAANDGLMCCLTMAAATKRIRLVTWIVNIYFRQPSLCAAASLMVQEASDGRFTLGLGVSHRPLMESLGIEMGNAREKLRAYTIAVRKFFNGEMSGLFRFRKPKQPIQIYYGALAKETSQLAGELADGVELYQCSPERMRQLADAARETARNHGRNPNDIAITLGLPTFLHDDLKRAYDAARQSLAFYTALPFYNRQMVRGGFNAEAEAGMAAARRGDREGQIAAISDRFIDSVALVGPLSRCVERLSAYRAAGAELLIIVPNAIGEEPVDNIRRLISAFAKAT
jgi:alkanesulfonate monooxygenase SsuD/methylene tetrahydromethanopterin reductase-like flavin-dependent oxidoreductase (luciferase family)